MSEASSSSDRNHQSKVSDGLCPHQMAEVLAIEIDELDEAGLQYLARMAAAAAVSQNTTTFGKGKSKDVLQTGINFGQMSIHHPPGEDTVRKRHEEEMLAEEKKTAGEKKILEQKALQSLAFPEMNLRESELDTEAAPETCAWILGHPTYKTWLEDQKGLLWIQGKPGAGKTTLLKYALQDSKESASRDNFMVASYFFKGRGAPIQKNPIGMFRSLLFQILSHFPHLLSEFSTVYKNKVEAEGKSRKKWEWKVEELRKQLTIFISRAAQNKHIRIYVDAVDESGEEDAARDIVRYFKRLTSKVMLAKNSVSICFACRNYPLKSVEGSLTICVEEENYMDIVKVVENALDEFPLEQAQDLAVTIVNRASGIFQWVVLVVDKLLKLYRQGKNMKTIKAELLEIPPELEHFYQEILESVPPTELPKSLHLMQWLCFSRRPLTIEELRWAMVVDSDCSYESLEECKSSMDWADTDNTMENRLTYLSGGLAEVVMADIADSEYEGSDNGDANDNNAGIGESNNEDQAGKAESSAPMIDGLEVASNQQPGKQLRRVAQFIHQSVEDYLTSSGLEKLDNYAKRSVVGRGHHAVLRSCIRYISMQEVLCFANELDNRQAAGSKLLTQGSGTETPVNEQRQRDTSSQVETRGRTINRVETLPTEPQAEQPTRDYLGLTVSDVDEDPDTQFLRIATELHRDHTRVRASGGESSQMGAAREQAVAADSLLDSSYQSDNQNIIVYRNQVDIPPDGKVSNEIEKSRDQNLQNPSHGDFPDTFYDTDEESPFRDVPGHDPWDMERRTAVTDEERRHRDKWRAKRDFPLLHYAVKFCLIHALLAEEEGIPQGILVELLETPKLVSNRQRRGVSPNGPSSQIITPWKCLHNLINVVISNDKSYVPAGTTLLHIASKYALKSVVEELLGTAHKNDADPKDANGWTPLFYAAQQGHDAVAQLLLKSGRVNPDTVGTDAWTPLSYSAACQSEGVMQMLLETEKVEVDRKDESGRTALWWASRFGSETAVQRLLDTGKVDVNLKDKEGNSILSWATEELYNPSFKRPGGDDRLQRKEELTAILQLLLSSGKIDSGKDKEGETLLLKAAKSGHDLLVQQLLKTGQFDVNSRDSTGRTPLSWAAYNGHVAVVKWLLKGRADVNSKDDRGRTPLSLALSYLAYINTLKPQGDKDEQENDLRMLLATRKLNIKDKDMDLWTSRLKPYSLERDHLAVVRLLLDTGKIRDGPDDQWVQPPAEWLALNGREEEDLKAAQAASLARIEKEEHEKHELEVAMAASLARKEEEDQEQKALEAALSISLLQPDDEDAIMKIVMAMSLEGTSNLPTTEGGSEVLVDNTDYEYAYYDDEVELELAKAASLADDIEKSKQATQNSAAASSHGNSVAESRAQQEADRLLRLQNKQASAPKSAPTSAPAPATSSPAPAPKPKPARLSQGLTETPSTPSTPSKPTPQPKPEHLTRQSPKPKPKPKHLASATGTGTES